MFSMVCSLPLCGARMPLVGGGVVHFALAASRLITVRPKSKNPHGKAWGFSQTPSARTIGRLRVQPAMTQAKNTKTMMVSITPSRGS